MPPARLVSKQPIPGIAVALARAATQDTAEDLFMRKTIKT